MELYPTQRSTQRQYPSYSYTYNSKTSNGAGTLGLRVRATLTGSPSAARRRHSAASRIYHESLCRVVFKTRHLLDAASAARSQSGLRRPAPPPRSPSAPASRGRHRPWRRAPRPRPQAASRAFVRFGASRPSHHCARVQGGDGLLSRREETIQLGTTCSLSQRPRRTRMELHRRARNLHASQGDTPSREPATRLI